MRCLPGINQNTSMLSLRAALSGGAVFFDSQPRATLHLLFHEEDMNLTRTVSLCCMTVFLGLAACENRQFTTLTLYESPASFVRLERDPMARENQGHSHPVTITPEEMAAVWSGLMIEEPSRLLSFFDKNKEPQRHPAFNEAEIQFFSPLLAKGLGQATPEEVVTFYQTHQDTAIIRKVTSGGVFVDGEDLHVVLSNYRSPTHAASDPGVDDTMDDRLTPMRRIAPQEARLDFEPSGAIVSSRESWLSSLFSAERREIVVRFRHLAPAKAGAR